MNERELAKVRGFINEKEMADAVYGVLSRSFLERRGGADVYMLAAQMLAAQLLSLAWAEMERLKNEEKRKTNLTNPGV